MYHPYFRGKQYELITIREMAPLMSKAGFRAIIEPVRDGLKSLHKTLKAVADADGRAVLIVNPHHGELAEDRTPVTALLKAEFQEFPNISAGILLKPDVTVDEAWDLYQEHADHAPVLVHAGFSDAKALLARLGEPNKDQCHIFIENFCVTLYRKQFKGAHCVLVRDGFKRQRNADYDPIESFSDLHATFDSEHGMDGFGDFLIVGDGFSESGGPAYAVAIHLTFIDPERFDEMRIYHFKSDTQDTPKDPAGKFAEALAKMMAAVEKPESRILKTNAVKEFQSLHRQGHFPGLGYVKKLSMNHHIETLAEYFKAPV